MVNRVSLLIALLLLLSGTASAQHPDSIITPVQDTVLSIDTSAVLPIDTPVKAIDSFSKRPASGAAWIIDRSVRVGSVEFNREVLKHHPYFRFAAVAESPLPSNLRAFHGKELLFYLLVFLLIVFGFLKRAFPKYFSDLFRLFFRTTLKQRQVREQLMQTPLPSLLMNGFFAVSGGLYITFILRYFRLDPEDNFWLLFLYCCIGLSASYFVKFIGLKISGWLFNMKEAAESYIFIVFIINKMIGIFLLPFLVLLAFSTADTYAVSITLSWCLVAGLLAYRFVLTYAAIRNQVKVNPFHFFLYLLAFEIAPLLLVYKALLFYLGRTT